MSYCIRCGKYTEDNASFCQNCGNRITPVNVNPHSRPVSPPNPNPQTHPSAAPPNNNTYRHGMPPNTNNRANTPPANYNPNYNTAQPKPYSPEKAMAKKDLLISIPFFILGIIVGIAAGSITADDGVSNIILSVIVCGSLIGGLRYGWKVLTFITPNIFLILPLIGWVIFFLVKFFLALLIAPFAFFIKTIINIIILIK